MTLMLTLEEAQEQLLEKQNRVQAIRLKLAETQALSVGAAQHHSRDERALAEAIVSGTDAAEALAQSRQTEPIEAAPISPSEARRIMSGLESLLATAQDEVNQAASTVRRAGIDELKNLVAAERQAYDEAALATLDRWARVTVLNTRLAAAVGIDPSSVSWARLCLPRAVPAKHLSPFDPGDLWPGAAQIMSGSHGNRARTEIGELLRVKGIEK